MQQPTHGTRRDAIAKIKAATAFTAIPLAFMALGLAGQASAQTPSPAFPSKTIRFVVPYPPGGPTDLMARMLQPELQQRLGVTVIVENKSGAGGNLGSAEVARQAPADGHTLLLAASGPMAVNSSLYKSMPFNPLKDLEPVVQLSAFPLVLEVHPSLGVKTVAELLALAKTGKTLSFASAGNGTSIHLAGEVFNSLAGVDILHIPYKGSGPAVSDLLGGQVNYMFDSITSARPHIQSGKLRALAVTTAKRSSSMPDVPTMEEAGIKGYEVSPWFAVFMPASTPPAIVKKLNQVFVAEMKQPDVLERFKAIGAEVVGSTPEEAAKHLQAESVRWTKVITERNISMD